MQSKLQLGLFALCCLPAFAQLDSSTLRAKLGQPLNRETFHMPAGFDLIVDYGNIGQVCKLEVPALMPHETANVWSITVQRQRMYDFLADLVPASARGKEGGGFTEVFSMTSLITVEYENVTVREIQYGNQPESKDNTITIRFKSANCPAAP
jgi:hypothetical protein